jgi:hypothetical protein
MPLGVVQTIGEVLPSSARNLPWLVAILLTVYFGYGLFVLPVAFDWMARKVGFPLPVEETRPPQAHRASSRDAEKA